MQYKSPYPGMYERLKAKHDERYRQGKAKPNYPMPATIDNAESAMNWINLGACPYYWRDGKTPCSSCIDKFIDQLLYDFPALD